MEIVVCPKCQCRVAITDNGDCPSCRHTLRQHNRSGDYASDTNATSSKVPLKPLLPFEPPKTDPSRPLDSPTSEPAPTHFTLTGVLFSLKGRIPRSVYWFALLGTFVVGYTANHVAFGMLENSEVALLIIAVNMSFVAWFWLSISVKRFHDLNMSGWWALLLLLPGVGLIFQFGVLGFGLGTRGSNAFGPDPLKLFT